MRFPVPIPSAMALGTCLSPSPRSPKPRDHLAQPEGSQSYAGKGPPPMMLPGGVAGGGIRSPFSCLHRGCVCWRARGDARLGQGPTVTLAL